jgi:hypothetical protein
MLENMNDSDLIKRYNNMIRFNNTQMAKIEWLREKITEAGGDVTKIGWCKHQYDRCSFVIGDHENLTREQMIQACRRLESQLMILNGVDNHTTMAYRMYVPVTYCPSCDKKVTVGYKMDLTMFCTKCDNRKGLRMVK